MQLAEMTKPQEISILLIEDSLQDGAAITKTLMLGESLYSFHVTQKTSLFEGLRILSNKDIHVVLLDLNLPDAKELKAIHEVRGLYPDVPIVVISGYSDMDIVHQALRSGAQEFLIKGECSGAVIRQSIYQAIARKKIEKAYQHGERI